MVRSCVLPTSILISVTGIGCNGHTKQLACVKRAAILHRRFISGAIESSLTNKLSHERRRNENQHPIHATRASGSGPGRTETQALIGSSAGFGVPAIRVHSLRRHHNADGATIHRPRRAAEWRNTSRHIREDGSPTARPAKCTASSEHSELSHARPKIIQPRSGTDSDTAHWLRRLVRLKTENKI